MNAFLYETVYSIKRKSRLVNVVNKDLIPKTKDKI